MALQFRRGTEADLSTEQLLPGEPAICLDSKKVLVGDGEGGTVQILSDVYLDQKLQTIVGGTPRGVFSTLPSLQAEYPNGAPGIYIVALTGGWYYWNGSAWTLGGPYQAAGIMDGSVNTNHLANNAVTRLKLSLDLQSKIDNLPENTNAALSEKADKSALSETNLRVAEIGKDLSDYKAVLSQLNPNQEAKQTVTDYGMVSLPANAANGQMDMAAGGVTASNLIQNGNFSNGTIGWTAQEGASIEANNNTMFVVPSAVNGTGAVSQATGLSFSNQKVYASCRARVNNPDCTQIALYASVAGQGAPNFKIQYTPAVNQWYRISGVQTINGSDFTLFIGHYYSNIASNRIMELQEVILVNLTRMFGAGNEPTVEQCDKIFANWFDGTKSTVSAMRIVSESEDKSQRTELYIPDCGELRRVPNGVGDKVSLTDRATIFNTKSVILNGNSIDRIESVGGLYDLIRFPKPVDGIGYGKFTNSWTILNNMPELKNTAQWSTTEGMAGFYATNIAAVYVDLIVERGRFASLSAARTYYNNNPMTLIYQLATPISIPVNISGTLLSYPKGAVYAEPVLPVAGIYTASGISVTDTGFPIASIEKIYKIDFATGVETPVDVSEAVVAGDGLSFTHPDLTDGDIVFFIYYHAVKGTKPKITLTYFDSRYVRKDSATGKFYKWDIAVTNGAPSIVLQEV